METAQEIIDTTTSDGEMAVLVTRPVDDAASGGSWPVVLMYIDAPGIRPATKSFTTKLAAEGYVVVTPDLHHRNGRLLNAIDATPPEGSTAQEMVWGWISSMNDDQIQSDADDALDAAGVARDTPIVTIGFCLGARAVFRRMMAEPDRVVAGAGWHPSFLVDSEADSPHLTAASLTQPLYLAIGDADQVQSIEMHRRFLEAVEPLDHVTVDIFPGADHGFTWPEHDTYDQAASDGAWVATTKMFAAAFA